MYEGELDCVDLGGVSLRILCVTFSLVDLDIEFGFECQRSLLISLVFEFGTAQSPTHIIWIIHELSLRKCREKYSLGDNRYNRKSPADVQIG